MTHASNGVVLKPHQHVRVKAENKMDLEIWLRFLTNQDMFCRDFMEIGEVTAQDICGALQLCLPYLDETTGTSAEAQEGSIRGLAYCR